MGIAFGPKTGEKPADAPAAKPAAATASPVSDHEDLMDTVAEDLVSAVHAKDKKGLTAALRAFLAVARAADESEAKD